MSDSIILTLGHNSSAIAVRDGQILGGYETERFTGKKSDSAYPQLPIDRLVENFRLGSSTDVFVGHWFLNAELSQATNKYFDYSHLRHKFHDCAIHSLDKEFSHHDSHLSSGMVFAGDDFAKTYHAFVLDGFGSFGECISVYKVTGKSYQLANRWFGYEKSLGMLYQYATAYMGMKQHNHEYKILAYEVHVDECRHNSDDIRHYAQTHAAKHVKDMIIGHMDSTYDPTISVEALPRIQLAISDQLDLFCEDFNVDKDDELEFRSCVSLYVQTYVETVVLSLIQFYSPTDALLVGGLFYNVKLNSLVQKEIPGRVCVMPLAGDQGAGLGVYQHYKGDLTWPDHLFWGHRDLNFTSNLPGLIVVPDMDAASEIIDSELSTTGFVNLVRGAMEFGPRALCNTTTLAMPFKDTIDVVNRINDRTTEMPCAPVMSRCDAENVFDDTDKVHKSLEYMIMARDYRSGIGGYFDGAAHYYHNTNTYTGRPQITDDSTILRHINTHGVLVNTSFNYHGVPIVFGQREIEYTHTMQLSRANSIPFKTVVVSGD